MEGFVIWWHFKISTQEGSPHGKTQSEWRRSSFSRFWTGCEAAVWFGRDAITHTDRGSLIAHRLNIADCAVYQWIPAIDTITHRTFKWCVMLYNIHRLLRSTNVRNPTVHAMIIGEAYKPILRTFINKRGTSGYIHEHLFRTNILSLWAETRNMCLRSEMMKEQ